MDQIFEAYERLDITNSDLEYPTLEQQLDGEGFYLKYKGHYRLDPDEVINMTANHQTTEE